MKIRPAHHAILCYAEWCCDNRRPWPKISKVAADLARDPSDIHQALAELVEWGLVSTRYDEFGFNRILMLGDGRETPAIPRIIPVVHKQPRRRPVINRPRNTCVGAAA